MVAMTDGLGSARKATRSGGRGGLGMALRRSPPTVGLGYRARAGGRGDVPPVDVEDHAVDALQFDRVGWARLTAWTTSSSVSVTAVF
jgi:hypothetical protein